MRGPGMRGVVLLCFTLGAGAFAQESDTLILKGGQQSYTVLSRVADQKERDAFLAAYRTTDASKRHELAQRFIDSYPRSYVLAQAYDVAAKSSVALGNWKQALDESRFSLRLMPENPTLLVLVANVEAQNQQFEAAERDARDALEYLDQFEEPESLEAQLKASAYFALGRAFVARGFVNPPLLKSGINALNHAAACNANDPEIFYLRAIGEARMAENQKAAADFAFAAKHSDSLRIRALAGLKVLHVVSVPEPEIEKDLCAPVPSVGASRAIREGYAGAGACQTCHPREYNTWRQTGMAKMLRRYRPENILGDFSQNQRYSDESGRTVVRMGIDSRPYFQMSDRSGIWQKFRVDYTIGSKWQQAYATKASDGRLYVFPIQYNLLRKEWINYWDIIDPPGSERAIISDFPKLASTTNYQKNCAICHTSQLRANSNDDTALERATFLEPGVDCEMCHGPAAWHVKQMQAGRLTKSEDLQPPVDFRRIGNREGVRICAQCHRQSAVRNLGNQNEMNFSATTSNFVPATRSRPYDAFSSRAFYKDGRFRETTFIVEAFMRSACYRRGTAQCASCHAPHVPDIERNPTALKFKDRLNEMCLGCHPQFRGDLSRHTHHQPASEGSQCVSCHMPRIVNALLFQARSHQIEIPTADLTRRFGQQESPNACLICHQDRDANWSEEQLRQWSG